MKKLLMHTCCAPCSTYVIKKLREEGFDDITSFWFNPNIQPYDEYKHRLETLKEYTQMVNVPLIIQDNYNLKEFLQNVMNYNGIRCEYCYRLRIEMSVKYAKENGFDCFTTTLLVSPYQKHDMLKKVCEDLSKEYEIEFTTESFITYYSGTKQGEVKIINYEEDKYNLHEGSLHQAPGGRCYIPQGQPFQSRQEGEHNISCS